MEAELESLNKKLIDISDVSVIKLRAKPKRISYIRPSVNLRFFDISLDKISKDAKVKVDAHIADHLKERDIAWLENGVALITDKENCPFCAQPLSKSPIFSMFTDFWVASMIMPFQNSKAIALVLISNSQRAVVRWKG